MSDESMKRLRAHKVKTQIDKLSLFEANLARKNGLMMVHAEQGYPGLVAMTYDKGTKVLTMRYIGLCMQWSLTTNRVTIQHGNEPVRVITLAPEQLHMRLLHQGKRGFM